MIVKFIIFGILILEFNNTFDDKQKLFSLKYQNKKIQNYLTNVFKNYFKKNVLCIKSIIVFELDMDTKVEL